MDSPSAAPSPESAIAGLVCGGAIAVAGALETVIGQKVTVTQVLNGASVSFGLGLYLWQRAAAGRFGTVAFVLQFLGFGYFAGIAYTRNVVLVYLDEPVLDALLAGPSRLAYLATALLALAGTVAFGVALWRAGSVPKPAVAPVPVQEMDRCLDD